MQAIMQEASRRWATAAALCLVSLALGCTTSGPVTIRSDRFNFNEAYADSTKDQLLLNIVRLRYGESISFVDIGSMLSHYTVSAGGSLSGYHSQLNVWNNPALRALYGMRGEPVPGSQSWGAEVNYSDSPTITYYPVTGKDFSARVLAPIPPATIIYLSQSGWGIDRLLGCCVQQIDDLTNQPVFDTGESERLSPHSFLRLAVLLKTLQNAGQLRFGVANDPHSHDPFLYLPRNTEELDATSTEICELLGLDDKTYEKVRLTSNPVRGGPDEVGIHTRSLHATMYALAQEVSVPTLHMLEKQTRPETIENPFDYSNVWLHVEHSLLPQPDAFVQVQYNGYWFYIKKSDWSSKRTFALLTYLFSLQSSMEGNVVPLLTVPTGG